MVRRVPTPALICYNASISEDRYTSISASPYGSWTDYSQYHQEVLPEGTLVALTHLYPGWKISMNVAQAPTGIGCFHGLLISVDLLNIAPPLSVPACSMVPAR